MNRAKGAKHVRTEGEYRKITQLRNSRGRDLISLFSRKVMRSWDRVRASTARCAKDGRCGDEKTAGGSGLHALESARSRLGYDTKAVKFYDRRRYKRKARISCGCVNIMFTGIERYDTYFHVNSAPPVSTARVILSSHNVASY